MMKSNDAAYCRPAVKIRVLIGTALLACWLLGSSTASFAAFQIPTTKAAQLAQEIKGNAELIRKKVESSKIWKRRLSAESANTAANIEAKNNAAANTIARINLQKSRIHNTNVLTNMAPSLSPCPAIDKSISLGTSVCQAVNYLHQQQRQAAQLAANSHGPSASAPATTSPTQTGSNSATGAGAPTSAAPAPTTPSQQILQTARQELASQGRVARSETGQHGDGSPPASAGGPSASSAGPLILNPNLIIGNQAQFLSYTPSQLKVATQMAHLLAPISALTQSLSPTNTMEQSMVLHQAQQSIAADVAFSAFMSLVALRTAQGTGEQSQYLLMWKMADQAFGHNGESGISLLQYLQDGNLSNPTQVMRKDALLKAQQTYMIVQKYATSLRREQILATRLALRVSR